MEDDRFAHVTELQRVCLRLIAAQLQIKQIAAELNISPSTVNARLERARKTIGATSSRDAARLLALHEQAQETWIPYIGNRNPLAGPLSLPSPSPDTAGNGGGDDVTGDEAMKSFMPQPPRPLNGGIVIPWPFPTLGRPDNDLNWKIRLGWVVPIAALSLLALLGLVGLSVGLQDSLAGIQNGLARLH